MVTGEMLRKRLLTAHIQQIMCNTLPNAFACTNVSDAVSVSLTVGAQFLVATLISSSSTLLRTHVNSILRVVPRITAYYILLGLVVFVCRKPHSMYYKYIYILFIGAWHITNDQLKRERRIEMNNICTHRLSSDHIYSYIKSHINDVCNTAKFVITR